MEFLASPEIPTRSFIIVKGPLDSALDRLIQNLRSDEIGLTHVSVNTRKTLLVAFSPRTESDSSQSPFQNPAVAVLLLGDVHDYRGISCPEFMANGASVRYDVARGDVIIRSSIVGLPPVYVCEHLGKIIITSSLYNLSVIPDVRMRFDPRAVIEFAKYGCPLRGRTLFDGIKMLEGGCLLNVSLDDKMIISDRWSPPALKTFKTCEEFLDAQQEAANKALRAMDLGSSALALTGGLDTRTILALLIRNEFQLPAFTLSGNRDSLDAIMARDLCQHYGLKHEIVRLDESFCANLTRYCTDASRLSGGLASLDQAHSVFFYKTIGPRFTATLSGYLGNQIGRMGTEGPRLRGSDLRILSHSVLTSDDPQNSAHWFSSYIDQQGELDMRFLLQQEAMYRGLKSYSICNQFSVQQSPYAAREMIEVSLQVPPLLRRQLNSLSKIRLRHLRHCFLGEAEKRSFQRRIVKRTGGYVASYPINWGWCAEGGISAEGFCLGVATLLDALASTRLLKVTSLHRSLDYFGITGLSDFRNKRLWLRRELREFVYDTLWSKSIRHAGVFEPKNLESAVREYYAGGSECQETIELALDLALAHRIFNASIN